ncbi:hypothetical protein GN956_G16450 [Arapaima gigas]
MGRKDQLEAEHREWMSEDMFPGGKYKWCVAANASKKSATDRIPQEPRQRRSTFAPISVATARPVRDRTGTEPQSRCSSSRLCRYRSALSLQTPRHQTDRNTANARKPRCSGACRTAAPPHPTRQQQLADGAGDQGRTLEEERKLGTSSGTEQSLGSGAKGHPEKRVMCTLPKETLQNIPVTTKLCRHLTAGDVEVLLHHLVTDPSTAAGHS